MTLANEWFTLKPETVKVDVYRNSAESAVRMTHLPTGIVVEHHFRFSDSYVCSGALEELTARVFHALVDILAAP
jgi:protein subunit release factor A